MSIDPLESLVVINVGGVKFHARSATLSSNSSYFEAQLSGDWKLTTNELFLDQDHESFKVLLKYMRVGLIDVTDIDSGVLLLAEYLGCERFISAVKIRAYLNLNPSEDDDYEEDELPSTFDEKYGGIRQALMAGFLPGAVHDDVVRTECAVLSIDNNQSDDSFGDVAIITNFGLQEGTSDISIIKALNWLHRNGYTQHQSQMDKGSESSGMHVDSDWTRSAITFSRIKRLAAGSIFVKPASKLTWKKEFAMIALDKGMNGERYCIQDELGWHEIGGRGAFWLEEFCFIEREHELEDLFRPWLEASLMNYLPSTSEEYFCYRIYSRQLERV